MVAERTPKPWHPRAFLLLPAAFNVANVAGPILSGILSEPLENFPHLFAAGSTFGGPDGIQWMKKYPYALPNLLCTVLLLAEALLVHICLEETLKGKRRFEPVRFIQETYANMKDAKAHGYRKLQEVQREGLLSTSERNGSLELERLHSNGEKADSAPATQRLSFRRSGHCSVLQSSTSTWALSPTSGSYSLPLLARSSPKTRLRTMIPLHTARSSSPLVLPSRHPRSVSQWPSSASLEWLCNSFYTHGRTRVSVSCAVSAAL
jgi:hypothetical protein